MKIQKYLDQSPLFLLNSCYEALVSPANLYLKKEKLNLLQALVLTALFFEERSDVTPSELAEIFQTSRGNMSHILSSLEEKLLIRRRVNKQDARYFYIELRADGKKKALAMIRFFNQMQEVFESSLGAEQTAKICADFSSLKNKLIVRDFRQVLHIES